MTKLLGFKKAEIVLTWAAYIQKKRADVKIPTNIYHRISTLPLKELFLPVFPTPYLNIRYKTKDF